MNQKSWLRLAVLVLPVLAVWALLNPLQSSALAAGNIIYVTPSGVEANAGDSWTTATTLQNALTLATEGDEIWVAAGIYKPSTNPAERNFTFRLKDGVGVYGGFAGTETARTERNWTVNLTVLSGDIDNNDTNQDGNSIAESDADIQGDNSYHVVTSSGVTTTAQLDGFVITAGQANTGDIPNNQGGGILNEGGSPTLSNLVIQGNNASSTGGGFYSVNGDPILTNIRFLGNSAVFGGGFFNVSGNPTLVDVYFEGNRATDEGGGLSTDNSSPVLRNVDFRSNSAGIGGAIYIANTGLAVTNVIVSGNQATNGGGLYIRNSNVTLTNVTISGNRAQQGGASFHQNSQLTVRNSIVWNNKANHALPSFINESTIPGIRNSLIEECNPGAVWETSCGTDDGQNLADADPQFVGAPNPDNAPTTVGDLRLQATSPAINAGDNTALPAEVTTDFAGDSRIVNGTVDLGAYEHQVTESKIFLPVVLQ
ncbi:hypothetical protein GC175_25980 [bacterium]|nr:hypothetical protein [bacterium]